MKEFGTFIFLALVGVGTYVVMTDPNHSISLFQTKRVSDEVLDEALVQMASELDKSMPMMLDRDTQIDSVVPLPKRTIMYKYTLVNYSKHRDFDAKQFVRNFKPYMINQCRTQPSIKTFREQDVTMLYNYSDRNGVFLAEFTIDANGR